MIHTYRSAEAGERVTGAREKFQQEEKTDKVSRPKRVAEDSIAFRRGLVEL